MHVRVGLEIITNSILHMFLGALSCTAPNLPKTAKAFNPKKMEILVIIVDTNLLLRSLVLVDLEVRPADKVTAALSRNCYFKDAAHIEEEENLNFLVLFRVVIVMK